MAPSKLSPELPLEILCEIIKFLPLAGLQTLSLASRLIRTLAIPFIFGHLEYNDDLLRKLNNIHQARKDVKEAIKCVVLFYNNVNENILDIIWERKLELSDCVTIGKNESLVMFQFLKTLPNLQILYIDNLLPAYIPQFISSIRHTSLLELVLYTDSEPLEGPPTAGLAGLEKLSIGWFAYDNSNEPGIAVAHLYELIRPTLTTLVELRIDNFSDDDFDLQLLKPCTNTLRTFEYTLESTDESMLDTIPVLLPHLTKLSIKWDNIFKSILWKDTHIQALSKNNNLTDLELSSDFEVNTEDDFTIIADDDYAFFVCCYKQRLKATQDIVSVCPRLQRCSWVKIGAGHGGVSVEMPHSFVVEERMTGGTLSRVVRGIKQDWMGRDHITRHREGGIVKCKLEDLPGDIIGQNDAE